MSASAPGLGPRLTTEQEFALELITRFAMNASREEIAVVIHGLLRDNMLLRDALVELGAND